MSLITSSIMCNSSRNLFKTGKNVSEYTEASSHEESHPRGLNSSPFNIWGWSSLPCKFTWYQIDMFSKISENRKKLVLELRIERVVYFLYIWERSKPAYTNNEINLEKNHKSYTLFSAVVWGQHIVELTTFLSAPKILF